MATTQNTNTSDKQAKKENLLTLFQNKPASNTGTCPVLDKIAIFPVRYAIDESPTERGKSQGSHPIPADWPWPQSSAKIGYLPNLGTRSYCIRQLRDGWLYVWDTFDQELHEYQIKGQTFTLIDIYDNNAQPKSAVLNTPAHRDKPQKGQANSYIEYSANHRIFISYSAIRCTDNIKKQLSRPNSNKWTRQLDLYDYCANQHVITAHVKPITQLGSYVADIQANALLNPVAAIQPIPDFTSTTVSTVSRSNNPTANEAEIKPVIPETAIQSAMPFTDAGIFVALDDPLGIIDDLTMNLIGRWGEYSVFDKQHQHKASVAQQCLKLIDAELTDFIPKVIRDNPEQYYDCIKDISYILERQKRDIEPRQERMTLIDHSVPGARAYQAMIRFKEHYRAFAQKWDYAVELYMGDDNMINYPADNAKLPDRISDRWRKKYMDWALEVNKQNRDDLRLNEMLDFMTQYHKDKKRFENHIDRYQPDLIAWLNRLDSPIETVFYDPADQDQLQAMAEITEAVTSYLSLTNEGKLWLKQQFNNYDTFIGLANFGFSKELYNFIQQRIEELDKLGESEVAAHLNGEDKQHETRIAGLIPEQTGILRAIDPNTVINRMGELQSFLSLDMVKNHAQFKVLSRPIQQIFDNLCALAANTADRVLERIASYIIPVLNESKILAYQTIAVVTNMGPGGEKIFLTRNQHFKQEMKDWLADINNTKQQIATLTDKAAIEAAKRQLNRLEANPPSKWFIEIEGNSKTIPALSYRQLYNALIDRTSNSATISQLKAWTGKHQGSALPLIVTLANIYNLFSVRNKLQTEGYSEQWRIEFFSATAYAANSAMAVWVMPMVENCKLLEGLARIAENETRIARLTKVAINKWVASEITIIDSAKHLSNCFAVMSLLGTLAARYEAYGVYQYGLDETTAQDEYFWTLLKGRSLFAMAGAMGTQTVLSFLARYFAFGWLAINPWFTAVAFVAGIVYLVASTYARYYKREGLRQWLHRCSWGKEANTFWVTREDGYLQEYHALYKTILQPMVLVTSITGASVNNGLTNYHIDSLWLGIVLPEQLAGQTIKIDTLLVDTRTKTPLSKGSLSLYQQLKNNSYWSALPTQDQPLSLPTKPLKTVQADVNYQTTDKGRLLMTWLDTSKVNLSTSSVNQIKQYFTLELKFTYPDAAFFYEEKNEMDKTYIFSLPIETKTSDSRAKLITDYYHQKPLPADLRLGNTVQNNIPQPFWVPTVYPETKG